MIETIGHVPFRPRHACQLPGDNGLPLLDPDGALTGIPDGQVVRCACGRAYAARGFGWRRARWWTLRRLRHG